MVRIGDSKFEASLDRMRQIARKTGELKSDELKNATQEFEAIFVNYLLKVMRSTVESADSEESSMGKDIYLDLFDNEIALNIARTRGLGIGEMMYEQLKTSAESGASQNDSPQDRSSIQTDPIQTESISSISMPVEGPVTSRYGLRGDPFTGLARFHNGIDIAAPEGTPFRAASGGTVLFAGMLGGYGNAVVIEDSRGDRSLYGHAAQLQVRSGDVVDANQVIGLVGRTGRATGSHLHFETEVNGQPVDPQALLASEKILVKSVANLPITRE
jgi:murein DD-endopeptidase MepM/ murein hydrolase activator NlpD